MKILRTFEEFIELGIVKNRSPNIPRAKSIINSSEQRKLFTEEILGKIGLSDDNTNYIVESVYDIIMGLIRARMIKDGYVSYGKNSHEAEVSYLRNLGFDSRDVSFMNYLRVYRNGIKYYGKKFDSEYGKKVLDFLNKIYDALKKIAEK